MRRVLSSLASRVDPAAHPLLDERATPKANGRALLIVITADRGLCGSFNTNVIKAAGNFITETPAARSRSGWSAAAAATSSRGAASRCCYEQINLFAQLKFEDAQEIATAAIDAFVGGEVDSVYLVYNEFKSVMVAARRRRAAAADPARGVRRRRRRRRRGRRRSTICTSRSRRSCSSTCCRATSKCRCSARCSNRMPRSTPRR